MKVKLIILTYFVFMVFYSFGQNEAIKSNFMGIGIGSNTFIDGFSSNVKYSLPMANLVFTNQKKNSEKITYFKTQIAYGFTKNINFEFGKSYQTNISYAHLTNISESLYLGGETSLNIHTRLAKPFKNLNESAVGGNLLINISPTLYYRKNMFFKNKKIIFFDNFSTVFLGLAISGGGNRYSGGGPYTTFTALSKYYRFNNSVGLEWQNSQKNKTYQLAFQWEFTSFKLPFSSKYGSSSVLLSKRF